MTPVSFLVWLIANLIADREPLAVRPANVWAGSLLLAVALVELPRFC